MSSIETLLPLRALPKGSVAEEALRYYFRGMGYYIVRGAVLRHADFVVTDVDLWLYQKATALARSRVVVDVKNKKTPQAVERVFWVLGLQRFLGADQAVVATTDRRPQVFEFGRAQGAQVIHGEAMRQLIAVAKDNDEYLSTEALVALIQRDLDEQTASTAIFALEATQAALLSKLGFDAANVALRGFALSLELCMHGGRARETLLRLLYIHLGAFLVALDYATASMNYSSREDRQRAIRLGISFGDAGPVRLRQVAAMAAAVAHAYTGPDAPSEAAVRRDLERLGNDARWASLAEHFSRSSAHRSLFDTARRFDDYGYLRQLEFPVTLSIGTRSVLFLLVDTFGFSRGRLAELFPATPEPNHVADSAGADLRATLNLPDPAGGPVQASLPLSKNQGLAETSVTPPARENPDPKSGASE